MKHRFNLSVIVVFVITLLFVSGAQAQSPLGTGFTYQGFLAIDGIPVNGNCDFQFSLWDALTSGAQVGSIVLKDAVLVTDGIFSVKLDFGAVFTGEGRWLEVAVRCPAGSGGYTTLSPRQELNAAPYALYSLDADKLDGQQASAFWNLSGNAGTTPGMDYIGTSDNQALEIRVNGLRVMRMEPNSTSPNILNGHSGNWITSGVYGAIIAGGGAIGSTNRVTDIIGTISGGSSNQAGNDNGSISDVPGITVGGGSNNVASGAYSVISGGLNNWASGYGATVTGGYNNVAAGYGAIVASGYDNHAYADFSFAAGRTALANHQGAFVWADSTGVDFSSTANNQFSVRASGGVRFETNGIGATIDGKMIWHEGNDGSGSLMDADQLDGQHASSFSLNTHNHDTSYWKLGGNAGTTPGTNYIGTSDNQALEFKVNALRVMRLEPDATSPNIIAGYNGNWITTGVFGATIGGGGGSGAQNRVTDAYGIVGGGSNNRAGDNAGTISDRMYATVSGGLSNTASGLRSVVSGGGSNTASGESSTTSGGYLNNSSGIYSVVSGGVGNASSGFSSTISGGEDNIASGADSTIPGGNHNQATGNFSFAAGRRALANHQGAFVWADSTDADFASTVANQFAVRASGGVVFDVGSGNGLRLLSHATSPNIIGGHSANSVTNPAFGATISGGGGSGIEANIVTDNFGVIGGGAFNQAGDNTGTTSDQMYAVVGGGYYNQAQGFGSVISGGRDNLASGVDSTISGGYGNSSSGDLSSIDGGSSNTASGLGSSIGGGSLNTASGTLSTVPGGSMNTAAGSYSFAAGYRAKANHTGTFIWADSSSADFVTGGANQFLLRATNGVYFYTNTTYSSGVALAGGGSAWSSISDRNVKDNFAEVDGERLLKNLAAIQISTWNYKAQDASIRHIGPMAQDFYAAFNVGEDNLHISTIDADGVALAGVQALYAKTQALQAEIDALKTGQSTPMAVNTGGLSLPWLLFGGLALLNVGYLIGKRVSRKERKREMTPGEIASPRKAGLSRSNPHRECKNRDAMTNRGRSVK